MHLSTFSLLLFFIVTFSQKNVILIIADGFGPAAHTIARTYWNKKLSFDQDVIGTVQTRSYNALITDSSSSATAYATGHKTINGYVGVDHNSKPLKTVLEAAIEKGMLTATVTSTSNQHATPASFLVHHNNRQDYELLAALQTYTNVSLMFGGGSRFCLPPNLGGVRRDGRNLMIEAQRRGITVIQNSEEFMRSTNIKIPTFAYLANDQLPYELDRKGNEPTLLEMARKAIGTLKGHPKGFFIMIEAGRIDHAFHSNDAGTALREIKQLDEVYQFVRDFVKNEKETILLSTADHETGGMSISHIRNSYMWYPEVYRNQRGSAETVQRRVQSGEPIVKVVKEVMGIDLDQDELRRLQIPPDQITPVISRIMADRARISFTSVHHSGVDVLLHAFGDSDFKEIRGNVDNTDIGKFIAKYLNLNINQ